MMSLETMETLALSDDPPSNHRITSYANGSLLPVAVNSGAPLLSPRGTAGSCSLSSSSSFINPFSYADADAVFSLFDEKNSFPSGDGGEAVLRLSSFQRSSSPRSAQAAASEYVRISVSDPQTAYEAGAGSSYVTYLIATRVRDSAGGSGRHMDFSVRRRFRDVVALAYQLAESHRGFFIPPRPGKHVTENQHNSEFLEMRRMALERYLWKLAEHPAIGKSDELQVFLQAQGKLPLPTSMDVAAMLLKQQFGDGPVAHVSPKDVVQTAKVGLDLLKLFKKLKQSVVNDWGGGKPMVVEEDKEFLKRKEKMKDLEQHLSKASQEAETFVKAQQDIGETVGELGLTLIKLTKLDSEEAVYDCQEIRAAYTKSVATAAVKASRLYRKLNSQNVKHLETLHEYLGLILAAQSAFSARASALLTVQTMMSDLPSLQTRIEKLEAASSKVFGGDKSRLCKVEDLRETIKVTEDAKSCAVREYERMKEYNRSELERLDKEKHDDFLSMLEGFVVNQI